ncbi:hypothetical protein C8J56DRAFT_925239 [Mycena floridula]|nr:hypothetical protein C8J56DRAFT_925239 [Mycena floridula]
MSTVLTTELCNKYGSSFISREFSIPNSLEKLRSGHILTDFETTSILFQLPTAAAELGRYDAQISQLRLVLHNLGLERDNLSQAIIHNRALTSPIRRIPAEILTIIFEWCLQPNLRDHDENTFVNDFTEPAKLQISILTGVCAFWRDIAVTTRGLWSNISVNLGSCTKATARLMKLHKQRSRKIPLTLTIHDLRQSSSRTVFEDPYDSYDDFYDSGFECRECDGCMGCGSHSQTCKLNRPIDPSHKALEQVKKNLVKLAPRFTRMVVYGFRWAFPFGNVDRGECKNMNFANLESVEIRLDRWVKPNWLDIPLEYEYWPPKHEMPKLHSLTLENVPIDSGLFNLSQIPYDQLTSLHIQNQFLDNIIRIAQHCPRLEHLTVEFQYMWDEKENKYDSFPDGFLDEAIIQDQLRSLQITVPDRHDPETVALLFSSLTTPSLQSVNLTGIAWPCPAFKSFIDRSGCSIEHLCLNQVDLADWALPKTISLMPRLTKLEWKDPFFGDMKDQAVYNRFLQLISKKLPELTHINLVLSLRSYQKLLDLIRSRIKPSNGRQALQHITVSIHPATRYNSVVAELEGFRKEGVRLDIRRHRDW